MTWRSGQVEEIPIELTALGNWTTWPRSTPRQAASGSLDDVAVRQLVRVQVPSELLRSLTLIDSPGVGSLRGHRRTANNLATATASAVLFVTDAKSPLTTTEVAFLEEVADQVGMMILAVTMTDELSSSDHVTTVMSEMKNLVDETDPCYRVLPW